MSSQSNLLLKSNIELKYIFKTLLQKGLLVYEYNPFRNYRCNETIYLDENDKEYTESLLIGEEYTKTNDGWTKDGKTINKIKYKKGSLIDFDTSELKFNIQNPITIIPQYSYDNSVNLILNDGYNPPRIINSRFSVLGKLSYLIVDRSGNSDTNIYNQGDRFESNISLYKLINKIPKLNFIGVYTGGSLLIGNYHFYFKYLDADGNNTDFVAESGLVSIFMGTNPQGIHSGFRDLNSLKSVRFHLKNVDTSYPYVEIYYTRATGDPNENYVKLAYKINLKYQVTNSGTCNIYISGSELIESIPISEINNQFNIVNSANTEAICQNRLFLGNVLKTETLYKELKDIALRFIPTVDTNKHISRIDSDYTVEDIELSYYSSKFIYDYTGYWPGEYYRLGVVFILSDFTLSSVYNIGGYLNNYNFDDDLLKLYNDDNKRNYLNVDEENGLVENIPGLNSKGIFKINADSKNIIGIKIEIKDKDNVKKELLKLGILGMFFVRQTRIPNTICQALTIATDKQSYIPLIPVEKNNSVEYISESFLNSNRILLHDYESKINSQIDANINAAICPEYSLNQPYFNLFFNGDEFIIEEDSMLPSKNGLVQSTIHKRLYVNFYSEYIINDSKINTRSKIIGIPDNVKLIAIDEKNKFSSRAGSAEQAWDFEFLGYENKLDIASNLVRGLYGPFLGIPNIITQNKIINIKLSKNDEDLFSIRMNDNSAYFSISDRTSLDDVFNDDIILYRGDCYICQYTQRINRNFNDLNAPYNDKIVDPHTFQNNVFYEAGVLKQVIDENHGLLHINLGDLNAVKLGTWITFTLRSNMNLCVRSIDESNIEEKLLSGHPRSFYPLSPLSIEGFYKLPESSVYNQGFTVSVSEKWNTQLPYVPSYKNDYTNRIMYSDINVMDQFKNGFRIFQSLNYRDYPKTYGQIIKLIEWSGNLICVFEHGVGLIPVNERVVAGDGPGGNVFINTNNVLPENPLILSDLYGSLFSDSIVKTPKFVYGVDTIGKKIWRTNGSKFEIISDFKVLEFLNNNITLSEREITPIIGIRNVKTFYNAFKQDVMFTYYDNVYGFEEKAWNLCFNETLNKFITFYSWIPSVMENIDNIPFSFDRTTSRYIAKLGIGKNNNSFEDGIVLSENVIPLEEVLRTEEDEFEIGTLSISNRILPYSSHNYEIEYSLEKDIYNNHLDYKIKKYLDDKIEKYKLYFIIPKNEDGSINKEEILNKLFSELYYRNTSYISHPDSNEEYNKFNGEIIDEIIGNDSEYLSYPIFKDITGKRLQLPYDKMINPDKIVRYLNIKAKISIKDDGNTHSEEYYNTKAGYESGTSLINAGYYESTVAIISDWNKLFLNTDFWKHGQAGNIDIKDNIYPTYWYGKQHPFEFEVIVVNDPSTHKIFTNLEIISNKAKPESFHYEIIGDSYDFAKDKPNMYYRQEAMKELWLNHGLDISYDRNYIYTKLKQQPKSADLIKTYYGRKNTLNEIEDLFIAKEGTNINDYRHLSGSEIVYHKNRQEYTVRVNSKAICLDNDATSLLHYNCRYLEDRWKVSINPILVCYKNEEPWKKPPYAILNSPIPNLNTDDLKIPKDETYDLNSWGNRHELDLKDKFIKIKIRYSGEELAVIDFLNTLYRISYA